MSVKYCPSCGKKLLNNYNYAFCRYCLANIEKQLKGKRSIILWARPAFRFMSYPKFIDGEFEGIRNNKSWSVLYDTFRPVDDYDIHQYLQYRL